MAAWTGWIDSASDIFAMIPKIPTVRRMTRSPLSFLTPWEGCGLECMAPAWTISTGATLPISSPDHGDPAGLPEADVLPLLLDGRGMLWMATAISGLVRLDTHTRKFTTYLIDPNHPGSQDVNWTEDVYSDGASIWVASPTSGLFRFDPETSKFTHHYTEKNGLASNTVLGVLGDAQGNVWVSTANGLSKFDPRTETFRQLRYVRRAPK